MCDGFCIVCVDHRAQFVKKYHIMNALTNFFAESDPCYGYSCHAYAKCYNRGGRAVCVCNDGYEGNGIYCKSKLFQQNKIILFFQHKILNLPD